MEITLIKLPGFLKGHCTKYVLTNLDQHLSDAPCHVMCFLPIKHFMMERKKVSLSHPLSIYEQIMCWYDWLYLLFFLKSRCLPFVNNKNTTEVGLYTWVQILRETGAKSKHYFCCSATAVFPAAWYPSIWFMHFLSKMPYTCRQNYWQQKSYRRQNLLVGVWLTSCPGLSRGIPSL